MFTQKIRVGLLLVVITASTIVGLNYSKGQLNNADAVGPKDVPFTFAAVGDFGSRPETVGVLQGIKAATVDYTLALGDLGYLGGSGSFNTETEWCNYVKTNVGVDAPFMLVAGNHDDGSDGDIREYVKCLPDRLGIDTGDYGVEYYFDYNNLVRNILISPDIFSSTVYNKGGAGYAFTEQAIDSAKAAGIEWIIVGMHKNCITPGSSVRDTPCEIGEDLFNMLVDKQVDLILQGHEHIYARSKPLAHSANCTAILGNNYNEACTATDGTILTISGAGGWTLNNINSGDSEIGYFTEMGGANNGGSFGFLKLAATVDNLSIDFINTSGGSFSDSFILSQTGGPLPGNSGPGTTPGGQTGTTGGGTTFRPADSSVSGGTASATPDAEDLSIPTVASTCADISSTGCRIVGLMNNFVNVVAALIIPLAVIGVLVGGINYARSSGDPAATAAAKSRIDKSMAVVLMSVFLYSFLQWLIPGGVFG